MTPKIKGLNRTRAPMSATWDEEAADHAGVVTSPLLLSIDDAAATLTNRSVTDRSAQPGFSDRRKA